MAWCWLAGRQPGNGFGVPAHHGTGELQTQKAEEAGLGLFVGGCIPSLLPGSQEGEKATGDQRQLSSIVMFYFVLAFFFFPLNILCFLTINHILRQKAFKETGHGVCFRSLAGEAGHQLTAVINPQLSDQSIFPPTLQGREGGPRQCQPPVPCHPRTQEGHRAASCPPVVAVPSGQCPLIPGTVPSCSALSRAKSHLRSPPAEDPSQSRHCTSCPSKKPSALQRARTYFPSRGYTKSLLGDKPYQEVS